MLVLNPEAYALSALARLKSFGHELTTDATRAEAALIRSRTRVDKVFLDRHPNLKIIITSTSGFDHIDWRETERRGIVAAHTPDANAPSTAELTIGLLIMAERQLLAAAANVRASKWRDQLPRPRGLEGHTLGVVGLGRVGRRVARLARLLGMVVLAYDPYTEDFEDFTRIGFTELLRAADYVTLHVPLTKQTTHLLNEPTFNEMANDAILINTCRGPVVDENDLLAALDKGTIAAAAVDVIEREPPPQGHRILTHPKLLMTPHIGAYTESAWARASEAAVEKLLRFTRGEPVGDTLPLDLPWFER